MIMRFQVKNNIESFHCSPCRNQFKPANPTKPSSTPNQQTHPAHIHRGRSKQKGDCPNNMSRYQKTTIFGLINRRPSSKLPVWIVPFLRISKDQKRNPALGGIGPEMLSQGGFINIIVSCGLIVKS